MDRIDIHTFEKSYNATLFMDKFALVNSIPDMRILANKHKGFLIDGFIAFIITNGEVQITIENETFHCVKGDILVCTPRTIIEKGMFNIDFNAFGFLFASDYAEDIATRLNFEWAQRIISVSHDFIHATDEEIAIISDYFNLIFKSINSPDSQRKERKINCLIDSMIYAIMDIGEDKGKVITQNTRTSSECIFQNFIKMLTPTESTQHVKYLKVKDYAEKLNITPKYLSMICKRLTGKGADKIINEEIIKSAKIMLHDSRYSLKQIADMLNFKNPSHFGTFFRKHTGMSPLDFRRNGQ